MIFKIIALCIVLGTVAAAPSLDDVALDFFSNDVGSDEASSKVLLKPDPISLVVKLAKAVLGVKATGITIAVAILKWAVANSIIIVFGALATLAFCKVTGKCGEVIQLVPVAELRGLVTSENLDMAERLLSKAVEKYAEAEARKGNGGAVKA